MKVRSAGTNLEILARSFLKPPCFSKPSLPARLQHPVVFTPVGKTKGLSPPHLETEAAALALAGPMPMFTEVWGRTLGPWGEDCQLELGVGLRTAF